MAKVFKTIYAPVDEYGFDMEVEIDNDYDAICVIIEGVRCPRLKEMGWVKKVIEDDQQLNPEDYREEEEAVDKPSWAA